MKWHPNIILAALLLLALGQTAAVGNDPPTESEPEPFDFWSLKPVVRTVPPTLAQADRGWAQNPIDHFIAVKRAEKNLHHSGEADRRTLIRRVYFDLLGLPPTPDEVRKFVVNPDPMAYERLVDHLLASPRYGERWARHWLDVVHYGDTHGYDKDKPRPNAWPYRDYVVRAFNSDKPYGRFVQEQLAGDALFPGTRDGIEGPGFISAGPWDFIGHAEVPETKLDGRIARNIDRDDMVKNTMNTFISTTVQCARCHDHKFDAVNMTDYYRMQAVFAALDRADREYYHNPETAKKQSALKNQIAAKQAALKQIESDIQSKGGAKLAELTKQLDDLRKKATTKPQPEYGYHSQIADKPNITKWVQVDLGKPMEITRVTLIGASDSYNNIGDGFGFPVRYKIEGSNDAKFAEDTVLIANRTGINQDNPGIAPQHFRVDVSKHRYIRLTAIKLAKRSNDYILAMGELQVRDTSGANLAKGKTVTALDSIEAPARWRRSNLVDDLFNGQAKNPELARRLADTEAAHTELLDSIVDSEIVEKRRQNRAALAKAEAAMKAMPKPQRVYVGKVHTGGGAFRGTGHEEGKPRTIRVLLRGDMRQPRNEVGPGTMRLAKRDVGTFALAGNHTESDRRVALARWFTKTEHPLTWRSIVNRVWQYHFGTGIVATPNDFGQMGAKPSHPKLLDWLAAEFRDNGQSIKQLHRLILTSATFRQSSASNAAHEKIDTQNRYLWRMNRRQLEAEALRDSVLVLSGKMNFKMYGPGFRDFVLEHPEHSPHYEYHKHDPEDASIHRRSVYRFLVRSQQQPFMTTLNCADPSQQVARRDNAITALQSLALLNNKLMVAMARHFANDLEQSQPDTQSAMAEAFFRTVGRAPSSKEASDLATYAQQHGLANTCRLLFNLNEFSFVD
ncbi:MAG: DUF1553 domain-containing protein [Verrucomicrobiota bacterium]|jgi:hypothetical protein|nr:DUF1553 domain-containing protein [Verrucomicrobiota bacterium]